MERRSGWPLAQALGESGQTQDLHFATLRKSASQPPIEPEIAFGAAGMPVALDLPRHALSLPPHHAMKTFIRGHMSARFPLSALLPFASIALLGIAFFVLGDTVVEDRRRRLDDALALVVHRHLGSGWARPMTWATDAASAPVVIPLILALCGWLLLQHRRVETGVVAGAWLGGQLLSLTLKLVYRRPRPTVFPPLIHASGFSYPSGHTITAVMTYGLLAVVIRRRLPRAWRWVSTAIAIGVVALVGLSRVYLGAHYPSDVLGSVLIAGAWLRGAALALRQLDARSSIGGHGNPAALHA